MTTAEKTTTKKELIKKAESLGIEGIDNAFPVKAIEMLIQQAEARIKAESKKSNNSNKTAYEKVMEKAASKTAQNCAAYFTDFQTAKLNSKDKKYYVADRQVTSNERSARMYSAYVAAYLYVNNLMTEEMKNAYENAHEVTEEQKKAYNA